ncbi:MAG TPA: hemerythrin domain-containing protein [Kofleriaceae bacterium]|nr:hemerythrin domain-containing protein [Kofleriaceae bacterium]
MLVHLGPRRSESRGVDDVVALLIECHGRMRKFLVLARRLAEAPGTLPAEVRDVARRIARYFTEAFPLHVADEDRELAPRLAGASAEVEHALARMTAEHLDHEPAIAQLIELCVSIAEDPRRLAALADELARVSGDLATRLESHLELEERVVFPQVRRLPAADQAAILAALRERRAQARPGEPAPG